jgi:hypothetical protein
VIPTRLAWLAAVMAALALPAAAPEAHALKGTAHIVWLQLPRCNAAGLALGQNCVRSAGPRVARLLLNGQALDPAADSRSVRPGAAHLDVYCHLKSANAARITVSAKAGEWLYLRPADEGCGLTITRVDGKGRGLAPDASPV